jgi:hypothetical protein
MKRVKPLVLAMGLTALSGATIADEKQDLLMLRNTTLNLIQLLVDQGVLTQEKADELIKQAEAKAQREVQQAEREKAQPKEQVVRVPYVPEFVKDEIREQLRTELQEDVVEGVMAQARSERWGVPDALPEWIDKVKIKGDVRLRAEQQNFASGNATGLPDFQEINNSGGFDPADPDQFLNTSNDRTRFRERVRLGVDAKVTNNMKAGIRMSTGNSDDPVSTNQTLGNYNNRYDVVLDRAYLKYDDYDLNTYKWLTLSGGRMPNPFVSTDLVWDSDVGFEGFAATYRKSLVGSDNLWEQDETDRNLFFTLGAFSLQEVALSSKDKWLFAGQLGVDWETDRQSRLTVAAAYYDYVNIDGRQNELNSTRYDFTAPEFVQNGNSMFAIGDPSDPTRLFGLASQYKLLNITASWDLARFAPTHVIITADYVKNLGWDRGDIIDRTGGVVYNATDPGDDPFDSRTTGYQLLLTVGWPEVRKARDWQLFGGWKHLERDAVLDAFTDSDFHLGGTNAEGWILGGSYGLMEDTWLTGRWLSADEIDGAPYGVDVLQIDLNARF